MWPIRRQQTPTLRLNGSPAPLKVPFNSFQETEWQLRMKKTHISRNKTPEIFYYCAYFYLSIKSFFSSCKNHKANRFFSPTKHCGLLYMVHMLYLFSSKQENKFHNLQDSQIRTKLHMGEAIQITDHKHKPISRHPQSTLNLSMLLFFVVIFFVMKGELI